MEGDVCQRHRIQSTTSERFDVPLPLSSTVPELASASSKPVPVSRALLILGMHRGGTSALTGVLSLLGGELPSTLMPATQDNPKGYFESTDLANLHDDLLISANTEWYSQERVSREWLRSDRGQCYVELIRDAVLRNYPNRSLFLVKDPRVSRLVPLWQDVLTQLEAEPSVIISVRDPVDVARSLFSRDELSAEHSNLVWLRHMLDAERDTRGLSRSVVHYDDLLADWGRVLRRVSHQLSIHFPRGLDETAAAIDDFLTAELRHSRTEPSDEAAHTDIGPWLGEVHRAYRALELDPQSTSAMRALDAVSGEFDRMAALFAPVLSTWRGRLDAERTTSASRVDDDSAVLERDAQAVRAAELQAALLSEQERSATLELQLSGVAADRDAGWLDLAAVRQALAAAKWELDIERDFGRIMADEAGRLRAELSVTRDALARPLQEAGIE